MKVAVVGGGVVGLTTALQLQQELRNAELTVLASSFDATVSHVAAGIFRISSSYSGPTEEITREWIRDSYDYYDAIRGTEEASYAGVTSVSGYVFDNSIHTVESHWLEGLVPLYRKATDEEFKLVGGHWKYGSFFSTLLTQCKLYLPWAREKLRQSGVVLKEQTITSLTKLADDYDVIMNCAGLGARELCNDRRLVPIRGQVIKVQAPWIKTFFYGGLDTYIIPGFEGVVTLGGSRSFDSENTKVCRYEFSAIKERCEKLVPAVTKAKVLGTEIGLRPHRENNVRVEVEHILYRNSKAMVVHNYGHGGYGVCTAPGTAKYAIQLAKDMHKLSTSRL